MTNVLYNSSVNHHPHGQVEVEVYDAAGNKLVVSGVYMAFNTVVVKLGQEARQENSK